MEKDDEMEQLKEQVEEIKSLLMRTIEQQNSHYTDIMLLLKEVRDICEADEVPESDPLGDIDADDLYEDARKLVVESGKASTSFLQRKLGIGYARSAKLIDMLEADEVIGPAEGAARQVLLNPGDEE